MTPKIWKYCPIPVSIHLWNNIKFINWIQIHIITFNRFIYKYTFHRSRNIHHYHNNRWRNWYSTNINKRLSVQKRWTAEPSLQYGNFSIYSLLDRIRRLLRVSFPLFQPSNRCSWWGGRTIRQSTNNPPCLQGSNKWSTDEVTQLY